MAYFLFILALFALVAIVWRVATRNAQGASDALGWEWADALGFQILPASAAASTDVELRSLESIFVRFTNVVTQGSQTKADVEFYCENPGVRITGMNFRMWVAANQYNWAGFTDFAPGYAASSPNPPMVATGNLSSGPALFGFPGAARYINGAVSLVDPSAPPVAISSWTKLFSVVLNGVASCPILILDKEDNPAYGGFLPNDGVTIVANNGSGPSSPTTEYVEHIGWRQTRTYPPFGTTSPCE